MSKRECYFIKDDIKLRATLSHGMHENPEIRDGKSEGGNERAIQKPGSEESLFPKVTHHVLYNIGLVKDRGFQRIRL